MPIFTIVVRITPNPNNDRTLLLLRASADPEISQKGRGSKEKKKWKHKTDISREGISYQLPPRLH